MRARRCPGFSATCPTEQPGKLVAHAVTEAVRPADCSGLAASAPRIHIGTRFEQMGLCPFNAVDDGLASTADQQLQQ